MQHPLPTLPQPCWGPVKSFFWKFGKRLKLSLPSRKGGIAHYMCYKYGILGNYEGGWSKALKNYEFYSVWW